MGKGSFLVYNLGWFSVDKSTYQMAASLSFSNRVRENSVSSDLVSGVKEGRRDVGGSPSLGASSESDNRRNPGTAAVCQSTLYSEYIESTTVVFHAAVCPRPIFPEQCPSGAAGTYE